jgi:signal transduction histidine kinase
VIEIDQLYAGSLQRQRGGINELLQKIADLAVQSLGADVVTLYRYDQSGEAFLVEGTGPVIGGELLDKKAPMRTRVYPGDVPSTVIQNRRGDFYRDVRSDVSLFGPVDRPGADPRPRFIDREKIKSMAASLLPHTATRHEEIVGVMFASYRTQHDFSIDERKTLNTFADFAAAAILNARDEDRRVRESHELVQAVTGALAHGMTRLFSASSAAVENLRERIAAEDTASRAKLDKITSQAKVLYGLAKRIGDRIISGKTWTLAPCKLEDLVNAVCDELEAELSDDNVTLERTFPPNLPRVLTDEFQLGQVVNDLFRNSIEAIRSRRDKDPACAGLIRVEARHLRDERLVELEIVDDGIG